MADAVAGTIPPRESFDVDRLDAFLKAAGVALDGVPEVAQFSGGASNLTYLVRYANRDLVLRRPPFGHKAKSAHDMLREAGLLTALRPHFPRVPAVVATCDDASVLGSEFVVMERLHGIIPQRDLPAGATLSTEAARALSLAMIDRLVDLHGLDIETTGLAAFGKGQGYVARQIEGWSGRFRDARTDDVADFEEVMAWLAANRPAGESRICLIHNDYKLDNLVLAAADPSRIVGVLDWEMAALGDPLMELGSSLAYWVEAGDDPGMKAIRRQPSHLPGMSTRAEIVARYGERTGLDVSAFDFYAVYGLFRLAGIAQQIYRRFRDGQAKNPAFAGFGQAVTYLDQRCRAVIAVGWRDASRRLGGKG